MSLWHTYLPLHTRLWHKPSCAPPDIGYAGYIINCSIFRSLTIPRKSRIARPRTRQTPEPVLRSSERARAAGTDVPLLRPRCSRSHDHISAWTSTLFRPATHKCGAGPVQNNVVRCFDLNPTSVTYSPKTIEAVLPELVICFGIHTVFAVDSRQSVIYVETRTTTLRGETPAGHWTSKRGLHPARAVSKTRSIYTTFGENILQLSVSIQCFRFLETLFGNG